MICPSKICKKEIPNDSLYCDQCGIQILRCTKCGNPGISKFCGNCGGSMAFKEMPAPAAATIVVPLPAKKLLFCHTDGWNLEISDGDVLGRTSGNHTANLGGIPVISGAHARVTRKNNTWYITDLKSTNKTYVGGSLLQADVPVPLKNNDVVQLANIKFIVREV